MITQRLHNLKQRTYTILEQENGPGAWTRADLRASFAPGKTLSPQARQGSP
ncbi:hypothetical protein HNR42_002910 [Deinobacterium chartae]|uniref:Uncharacterized protein n=1 Tax=Deinobacterium chartae TaxID=521158 RepID=A0A841I4V9_9DEIO|nr:hypothetical protein [Deinobacterium chartae]MBB6099460.1 hypothetical protein [Deinobacterium chartae]